MSKQGRRNRVCRICSCTPTICLLDFGRTRFHHKNLDFILFGTPTIYLLASTALAKQIMAWEVWSVLQKKLRIISKWRKKLVLIFDVENSRPWIFLKKSFQKSLMNLFKSFYWRMMIGIGLKKDTFAIEFHFSTAIFGIYNPKVFFPISIFDFKSKYAFDFLYQVSTIIFQSFCNAIKNQGWFEVSKIKRLGIERTVQKII